jgi:hypothetical protein
MRTIASLLAATTILASCTNGPDLIVNSHAEYNQAVRQVMNEELLLNIVRMRYAEAPQFIEVSGITTTFETTSGFDASGANLNTSGISSGIGDLLLLGNCG